MLTVVQESLAISWIAECLSAADLTRHPRWGRISKASAPFLAALPKAQEKRKFRAILNDFYNVCHGLMEEDVMLSYIM
jgi:hypothetical protein